MAVLILLHESEVAIVIVLGGPELRRPVVRGRRPAQFKLLAVELVDAVPDPLLLVAGFEEVDLVLVRVEREVGVLGARALLQRDLERSPTPEVRLQSRTLVMIGTAARGGRACRFPGVRL